MRKPVLMSVLIVLAMTAAASACPMCKDSIPNSDAAQAAALPGGFNNSIYLFLFAVFTVATSLCVMMFKAIREANRPVFQVVREKEMRPRRRGDTE